MEIKQKKKIKVKGVIKVTFDVESMWTNYRQFLRQLHKVMGEPR